MQSSILLNPNILPQVMFFDRASISRSAISLSIVLVSNDLMELDVEKVSGEDQFELE